MATTREKLESMLVQNGMSESQAKKVMDIAIPELQEMTPSYKITFDRPSEEYDDRLFYIIFSFMRPIALKWIEENAPQAWFKPMFM